MHMTRKMLEFELGRYKKKVADQQKEIQKLKADIVGYEDSQDGMFAMMAAIVEQAGELTISQARIEGRRSPPKDQEKASRPHGARCARRAALGW